MVTRVLTRSSAKAGDAARTHAGLAFVDTSWGRISLTLHHRFDAAMAAWKSLQSLAPSTHAQSFDCARAWFEEVASAEGAEAIIVTGRSDTGKPLFLWPFEVVSWRGLRKMKWLGQDLSNYNMGLFDPAFARAVTAADVKGLLREAVEMAGGVSLAQFANQPVTWEGMPNPLKLLAHQPAPNCGFAVLLDRDFETLYRNRFGGRTRNALRRKERNLSGHGELEYGWAKSAEARDGVMEVFFRQKSEWFAHHGIADPFADSRARAFIKRLAALPEGTPGRLELAYLKAGDTVVATYSGGTVHGRFHLLLSSIQQGETERWSPGILLLRKQIEDISMRGCHRYDLGTGKARHKSEWADEEIPLFDSFLAFDEIGYLITVPLSAQSRAKRLIKNNPRLWSWAQAVRRALYRRGGGAEAVSG